MEHFHDIMQQSVLFLPLCLGIFLNFFVLRITDLTTDGSFVLGAGLFARLFKAGVPLSIAMLAGTFSGFCVGWVVGLLQRDERMSGMLAGILGLFILQGLNLIVMGRPNISLLELKSMFLFFVIANIVLVIGFLLFFHSTLGTLLMAFGSNRALLKKIGYSVNYLRCFGLGVSSALAAASGCFSACSFGYADLGMGYGATLVAIGMVMIGLQVLQVITGRSRHTMFLKLIGLFGGVLLYFSMMQVLLFFGIDTIYLKLAIGLLLSVLFSTKYLGLVGL